MIHSNPADVLRSERRDRKADDSMGTEFASPLAFVGIAFLIYFIHHIAISIQASSIIADAASENVSGSL